MSDGTNQVLLSAAVILEIAIKRSLGKLQTPEDIAPRLLAAGAQPAPLLPAERLPPDPVRSTVSSAMRPPRRIALVVGIVVLGVAGLPAAAQANAIGVPETAEVTVPAGGTGAAHTDNLPANATQGTIEMQAQASATTDTLIDVVFALAEIPTPGKRFVACAMMTYGKHPAKEVVKLTENDPSLQLLFFALCVTIAQHLALPSSPAADMARTTGPSCSEQRTALPIKVTRSGGGYQGVVNGSTFTPRTPSKMIVTCRRKGAGLLITVKPRKRGQTLRQAVGPTLGIGFANHGTKPAPLRVTFIAK